MVRVTRAGRPPAPPAVAGAASRKKPQGRAASWQLASSRPRRLRTNRLLRCAFRLSYQNAASGAIRLSTIGPEHSAGSAKVVSAPASRTKQVLGVAYCMPWKAAENCQLTGRPPGGRAKMRKSSR